MAEGDYLTLSELNSGFGTRGNRIYAVGYILSEYIVERWGMEALRELIETNSDIPSALGLGNVEFEEGWYAWIKNKYLI